MLAAASGFTQSSRRQARHPAPSKTPPQSKTQKQPVSPPEDNTLYVPAATEEYALTEKIMLGVVAAITLTALVLAGLSFAGTGGASSASRTLTVGPNLVLDSTSGTISLAPIPPGTLFENNAPATQGPLGPPTVSDPLGPDAMWLGGRASHPRLQLEAGEPGTLLTSGTGEVPCWQVPIMGTPFAVLPSEVVLNPNGFITNPIVDANCAANVDLSFVSVHGEIPVQFFKFNMLLANDTGLIAGSCEISLDPILPQDMRVIVPASTFNPVILTSVYRRGVVLRDSPAISLNATQTRIMLTFPAQSSADYQHNVMVTVTGWLPLQAA